MGVGAKKAFILAGGLGTRLRPVTLELSKLVLPVQGKPCLQWNVELAKRFGAKEIVLAVGFKHEQIEEKLGNGEKLGIKIHYSVEKDYLGTAGALKMAEAHFKDEEKFIMMNGDEIKDIGFKELNEVFEKNKAVAALALTTVAYSKAGGLVKLEGERITEFSEKPPDEEEGFKLISAGAYILSPKVFEYIPAGKNVSIEKEVFPKLADEGKLFGLDMGERQFLQTDTFERYEKAIREWKGFTD